MFVCLSDRGGAMADTRKFVLPGQPPGTSRRLCFRDWGFLRFPREREHGEFDGFSFSGGLVCYGYGCVFVSRLREGKKTFTCCVDRGQAVLNGVVHLRKGRASWSMFLQSPRNLTLLKKKEFRSISGLCKFALSPCGILSWISFSFIGHVFSFSFFPKKAIG